MTGILRISRDQRIWIASALALTVGSFGVILSAGLFTQPAQSLAEFLDRVPPPVLSELIVGFGVLGLIRNRIGLATALAVIGSCIGVLSVFWAFIVGGLRPSSLGGTVWLWSSSALALIGLLSPARAVGHRRTATRLLAVGALVGFWVVTQYVEASLTNAIVLAATIGWLISGKRWQAPALVLKAVAAMHFAPIASVVLQTDTGGLLPWQPIPAAAFAICIHLLVLTLINVEEFRDRCWTQQNRALRFRRLLAREREAHRRETEETRNITSHATIGIVEIDLSGNIVYANPAFADMVDSESALEGTPIGERIHEEDRDRVVAATSDPGPHEVRLLRVENENVPALLSGTAIDSGQERYVLFFNDLSTLRESEAQRKRMELELRLSHKLEAVGKLAAGIAHEINTPIQYLSDSIHFIQSGVGALNNVAVCCETQDSGTDQNLVATVFEENEIEFYREELPRAFDRTFEGIGRISEIVKSMKQLAYPDQQDRRPCDLNQIVRNAVTIARHEYTQVAEVELLLDGVPDVLGYQGELTQVIVNMVVNAGHAIADSGKHGENSKGRIAVSTSADPEWARVSIQDDGCGIPDSILTRIFDPYFTTKQVGRGSGQGLAISRAIIVDHHEGRLDVDSVEGKGSTFTLSFPIAEQQSNRELIG